MTVKDLAIRPLEAADETEWRRLWTGYLEYYESAVPEAVYEAADPEGCPDVNRMTQHFNQAGRRLYDRVAERTPFVIYERNP